MYTLRTTVLSLLLTLALAAAVFTSVPLTARAAQPAASCPVFGASTLTTQQLRAMLDARYLYRVGLPR